MSIVFLDNNSTTRTTDEILHYYNIKSKNQYFNINTESNFSLEIKKEIKNVKKLLIKACFMNNDNIDNNILENYDVIFTSGATEANKIILKNFDSIITSAYEHKSILDNLSNLSKVVIIKPDKRELIITPESLLNACTDPNNSDIELVSIMSANNEIPVRNDLKNLYDIANKHGKIFHTDATQLFGKNINNNNNNYILPYFDILTFSAHKFHSLKGIGGIIYNKKKLKTFFAKKLNNNNNNKNDITSVLNHVPTGTPNSTAILTLGKTFENKNNQISDSKCLEQRNNLLATLHKKKIKFISIEPRPEYLHPNTLLLSLTDVCNIKLKKYLDALNIIVSIGSACNTNEKGKSHVLKSIDCNLTGIIRVSFGIFDTLDDIKIFCDALEKGIPYCKF